MSVNETTICVAFAACFLGVCHAYVFYPLLLGGLAALFGRRDRPAGMIGKDELTVSLLVAAFNEESVIEARIKNALAMDYPRDRFEIVIASDGSTDGTNDAVSRFQSDSVRLVAYPQRRGKATVLNETVPVLSGEIVIFSDANTDFASDAARKLVRWFADERVGAVCGELVLRDPATGTNADSLYWRYEQFMKKREGQLNALLGANGGIYAIRKTDFCPIPPETIVDDFTIPLLARLKRDIRVVYDPEARAYEETPLDIRGEFGRRVRIGAGGFQSIALLWPLLNPARGWIAFAFLSHKLLRWLSPFFLLGMLICSVLLIHLPFFKVALAAEIAFYLLAGVMAVAPARVRVFKPLRLSTMFVGMNLAILFGFFRWARGSQQAAWRRTDRETAR